MKNECNSKECSECHNIFFFEKSNKGYITKFCSQKCKLDAHKKRKCKKTRKKKIHIYEEKFCKTCNATLIKKEMEKPSEFRKRKYCNKDCRNKSIFKGFVKSHKQKLFETYPKEIAEEMYMQFLENKRKKAKEKSVPYLDFLISNFGEKEGLKKYKEYRKLLSSKRLGIKLKDLFVQKYGKNADIEYDKHIEKMRNMRKNYKNNLLERVGEEEFKKIYSLRSKKISDAVKKRIEDNPEKYHPYIAVNNRKDKMTYPEKLLKQKLIENGINNFENNYPVKRYLLDFAFLDIKLNIEIDGPFHDFEESKICDKKRDEFNSSNGWTIMRFKAKEIIENIEEIFRLIKDKIQELSLTP